MYHGPMESVASHFKSLGFTHPRPTLAPISRIGSSLCSSLPRGAACRPRSSVRIPTEVDDLIKAWRDTEAYRASIKTTCGPADIELNTPFSKRQFSLSYPRTFADHFKSSAAADSGDCEEQIVPASENFRRVRHLAHFRLRLV